MPYRRHPASQPACLMRHRRLSSASYHPGWWYRRSWQTLLRWKPFAVPLRRFQRLFLHPEGHCFSCQGIPCVRCNYSVQNYNHSVRNQWCSVHGRGQCSGLLQPDLSSQFSVQPHFWRWHRHWKCLCQGKQFLFPDRSYQVSLTGLRRKRYRPAVRTRR